MQKDRNFSTWYRSGCGMNSLLDFKGYHPIIRKYQSIYQRLVSDNGPPRRSKVVFIDKSVMHIEYGNPTFLSDVENSLAKMISREKKSRGLEN